MTKKSLAKSCGPQLFEEPSHATPLDRLSSMATETGSWWHEESFPKKLPAQREARFDPRLIDNAERHLLSNEMGWQSFFRTCNVQPFRIVYEDLVENYEEILRKVLVFLDVPEAHQVQVAPPRVRSQSDSTTEQWLAQYVDFKRHQEPKAVNGAGTATIAAPTMPDDSYQIPPDNGPPCPTPTPLGDWPERRNPAGPRSGMGVETAMPLAETKFQIQARQRMHWLERMLQSYSELVRLDPDRATIERHHSLSATEFLKRFYAANRPVILTDLQRDLRSIAHLTPEYFKSALAEKMVDMSARGKPPTSFMANGVPGKSIPFAQFIDQQILVPTPSRNVCFTAPYDFFRRPDGSSVMEGVTILPEYLNQQRMPKESYVGIEPAGFVSPLRSEPVNVLVLQVYGHKTIRLIPWYEFGSIDDLMASANNAEPNQSQNVKQRANRETSILEVTLALGEALFVPLGWWHSERASDVNITLALTNFLFPNRFAR